MPYVLKDQTTQLGPFTKNKIKNCKSLPKKKTTQLGPLFFSAFLNFSPCLDISLIDVINQSSTFGIWVNDLDNGATGFTCCFIICLGIVDLGIV